MENERRRNEDFHAPRIANMLRIPTFKWPTKPKPAWDPMVFDIRWLLIVASDAWGKKVLFRPHILSMREASRNKPYSFFKDSKLSDAWPCPNEGD